MADERPLVLTRRGLLRAAALASAAASVPIALVTDDAPAAAAQSSPGAGVRAAFDHLTAAEADVVEAIAERLIPTDANGPGAKEARVVTYIDRALGGALAASRQAYGAGVASIDRFSVSSRGKPFLQLSPADQDDVLRACERGDTPGFDGSPQFFAMILAHTRQGMFGDPYYGGNANFVGWDLIRYPGVRTMVTAADQRALEAERLRPSRTSAYESDAFTKAVARADGRGDSEAERWSPAHDGGRAHGD